LRDIEARCPRGKSAARLAPTKCVRGPAREHRLPLLITMSESDLQIRAQGRVGSMLCAKYRLDGVLGVGGMAVVFAATHRNQKRVAIKVLHPELSIHEELRTRFLREGYAANTVDHPGAVAVLDDDTAEDGAAFLVMERLEGDEVDRLWEARGRRLDAQVVLAMTSQLLDVLAAAHAKAIVHRDIKPSNLYVTRDGTLKVLDFGIARVRDAASAGKSATSTGIMLGTPAYMAPEQALGKSNEIDGTTDIWSVGATMFSLLSGRFVHEGENATQLVVMTATTPARSLAVVAPDTDPRLVALVDRALAFQRAGRWPSALAMRDAVRATHAAMFGTKVSKEPLMRLLGVEVDVEVASTMHAPSTPPAARTPAPVLGSQDFTRPVMTLDEPRPVPLPRTREMSGRPSLPGEAPRQSPSYAPPPGYAPGGLVVQRAQSAYPPGMVHAPQSGATTALPVSREPLAAGVPRRNALVLPIALIGGGLVVATGVWLGLWLGNRTAAGEGAPVEQTTTPPSTVAPVAHGVPSPSEAASVLRPAPPLPQAVPAVPTPPRAAITPAPQPPSAPRTTTAKPNCNPWYTIDPKTGDRVPKPECLP
jgi:eukaryotic-like serine/threonine-protein kinase